MLKKFAAEFPNLEKGEADLNAGDVSLRQHLEAIVPYSGDRTAWFHQVSRHTGIGRSRVKSIFYNRQCRVWGSELARIQTALSKAATSQNQKLSEAVERNGESRQMQHELDRLKGELKSEIIEEMRGLFLELLGSGNERTVRHRREISDRH